MLVQLRIVVPRKHIHWTEVTSLCICESTFRSPFRELINHLGCYLFPDSFRRIEEGFMWYLIKSMNSEVMDIKVVQFAMSQARTYGALMSFFIVSIAAS